MKHACRAILCSLIACTSVALAQEGSAGSSTWTLCTDELELIETILTQGNEQEVVTVDAYGIRHRWAIGDLFFAVPTDPPTQPDPSPGGSGVSESTRYIALADGQVVKGALLESQTDDVLVCSIYTGTTMRGSATIALEEVLSISDRANLSGDTPSAQSDSITTITNDMLVGFIESVGARTSISTSRGLVEIGLAQIRTMRFANIPQRIEGVYLSTSDGLRLRVSAFDFDFQHALSVTIGAESLGFDADSPSVWMMDPDAPAGLRMVHPTRRVISLTSITPQLIEPTGDRTWTPTPTVLSSPAHPILSTIDLHAPVRVIYPVPKGSARFACTLVAPINTWTDCIATIYAIAYDGQRTELLSTRLNADHPSQSLNAVLKPNTEQIEIRIDPGASGPIQDRVLIEHPRILIETS